MYTHTQKKMPHFSHLSVSLKCIFKKSTAMEKEDLSFGSILVTKTFGVLSLGISESQFPYIQKLGRDPLLLSGMLLQHAAESPESPQGQPYIDYPISQNTHCPRYKPCCA